MSLDLNVYTEKLEDTVIPVWFERLNRLGMTCEPHPGLTFGDRSGFLPVKVVLSDCPNRYLNGRELLSGFELTIRNFDLETEKALKKKAGAVFGMFKLFRPGGNYLIDAETDHWLRSAKRHLEFHWGSTDTLELRLAYLSSLILTDLCHGVWNDPQHGEWRKDIPSVEAAYQQIRKHESSVPREEWKVHDFTGW